MYPLFFFLRSRCNCIILVLLDDVQCPMPTKHNAEKFIEIAQSEIFPSISRQHLDELLLVASVVENAKYGVLKFLHHPVEGWLIFLDFLLVDFVIDFIIRGLLEISCHLFDDGGDCDHETHRC